MTSHRRNGVQRTLMTTAALAFLGACAENPLNGFDFDLRDLGDGFDTSDAVANLPDRPAPDERGVISYPTYQVVLAKQDDSIRAIATRLGLNAATLATFNGIDADATLRRDEVIALPSRVAEPTTGTTGQPLDVASVATTALDRADAQQPPAATPTAAAAAAPARQIGAEPVRYQVGRGDTAFTIARQFNIPVASIAEWNALGPELAVREGQFLLIPQSNTPSRPQSPAAAPIAAPGIGSATPVPPSASAPLPDETPSVPVAAPTTPDTGVSTAPAAPAAPAPTTTSATNNSAQLVRPVSGNIIRAYAPGRNEGIDIGVAAGTTVQAADAGTVAAVTTDTSGTAIVVLKHAGNLLTVYTNLADLAVEKGASVSRGQPIAKVAAGDPSFLHFEVRRGLEALDPTDFLP